MKLELIEVILTIIFENGEITVLYYDPIDEIYFFNLGDLNLNFFEDMYLDNFLEKIAEIRKNINQNTVSLNIETVTYVNKKGKEVSSDSISLERILDVSIDYIRDNYSRMIISYMKEPEPLIFSYTIEY